MNSSASSIAAPEPRRISGVFLLLLAAFLVVSGIVMAAGGAWLIVLGGSTYYALAGTAVFVSGVLLSRDRPLGATLYALVVAATIPWALSETGLDGWALVPRLFGPALILAAAAALLPALRRRAAARRLGDTRGAWIATGLAAAMLAMLAIALVWRGNPHDIFGSEQAVAASSGPVPDAGWSGFGGGDGASYSALDQITPANVAKLALSWSYRAGDDIGNAPLAAYEVTPTVVGDTLYTCTPHSILIAVDAATGKQRWRFDPKIAQAWSGVSICRGVTYYRVSTDADGRCGDRIALGTVDFRLIAVDARDGRPCAAFGVGGTLDLKRNMGHLPPGSVTITSPATLVDGKLVIGHFVMDNQRTDPPPGVVRAFDAKTGAFAWAWDIGRPGNNAEPTAGQTYALGTPNAWTPFAADPALGLIYVPTGNPGADFFGGTRTPEAERFGSAIVALDVATGRPRWVFRTVRHDLWDYDVGSQPALIDFPSSAGPIPALVQATKTGQLFVLDRRDGNPVVPVMLRRVPTDGVPGERVSPVQPFSTMPDLSGGRLTEADSWGVSPIDQMLCRIQFRRSRYAGPFTPMGTDPTIVYPGYAGGMDWGSVSFDRKRGLILVPATHVANRGWLVERSTAEQAKLSAQGDPGDDLPRVSPYPQKGTPYGVVTEPWLSPLGVPCQRPPWGMLTAVDIATRQVRWQRPLGDASRSGPFGMVSHIPFVIGTPNRGGVLTTAGGVTFVSAALDGKLRAFDTASGKLLWQVQLPAGGQATPISYAVGGKQYIAIAAGGHSRMGVTTGDYMVAFRL